MEEIAKVKAKFKTETSYVSTNDVVTAWLASLVPKTDNIFMAINCRGRIAGVEHDMAGNYLG